MQIARKRKVTARRRGAPEIRRKNLNLDQRLIERARTALGATTETDAITRAVEELIDDLTREMRRVRRMPAIVRAFILGSELPSLLRT